jgi:CDP-glucose 4,6-dehydratase
MEMKGLFNNIFDGKTVLVTGHTGFKGSWLPIWYKYWGGSPICNGKSDPEKARP